MQFIFPQNLDEFKLILCQQELKYKIKNLAEAAGVDCKYKFFVRKKKYLYSCCTSCSSYLRFRFSQEGEYFSLSAVQPLHKHSIVQPKFDLIQHAIKLLPPMITRRQAKLIIMAQFPIKSSQFYYLYNKIVEPRKSFQQYVKELNDEKCDIHYQPFLPTTQKPDLMIIVTPTMKQYYSKYGASISIDFTFNLFKDISQSQKTYKAGFIVGTSFSKRLVPFAILLSTDQSKETYYRLIKSFGQIVGSLPNIIVTDETLGAIHAIKNLSTEREFQGIHALDTHHILKNIYAKLKIKENIKFFSNLIKAEDDDKFQFILQTACEQLMDQELKLLQKFVANSEYYCLSKIPSVFISRIPTTSPNQKSHDLLKTQLPFSKPITTVLKNMIKLSNHLLSQCEKYQIHKVQLERYFGFSELRLVRFELDYRLFESFCEQLSKSLRIQLIEQQQQIIAFDLQRRTKFKLRQGQFEGRVLYLCTCNYQIKIGLPCRHQLKQLLIKGHRCLDYISDYWKISNKLTVCNKERAPTGRKTRRRR